MPDNSLNSLSALSGSRRFLPFLLAAFAGSGCSALIYEVVWLQLLQLVIGSSAVSLAVLLGIYMGGMFLGSLALPRSISARRHPLRVYALLEIGIGAAGIAILFGMPAVVRFYTANAGHGFGGILLRGAVSAACLLLPTMLMGATLPAVARWVEQTPQGASRLGFLYAGNIAGAVFGCLLAGFYLMRVHDMATATYVAAVINGFAALLGLGLATRAAHHTAAEDSKQDRAVRPSGSWLVYAAIALSGLGALGAEVVWTRLLSLMLGGTVYTFSIILAVFLAGLGVGSGIGSFLARGRMPPRLMLGYCQVFLTAAVSWAAYMLAKSLPYWPVNPKLSTSPWFNFQMDLARCIWAIFPAACLWGASFPLAMAAVAARGKDWGRLVGEIYASNTIGAIVGAVGFSLVFIPVVGTQESHRLLIVFAAAAALLAFASLLRLRQPDAESAGAARLQMLSKKNGGAAIVVASTALTIFLVLSVPAVPWKLTAYGRYLPTKSDQGRLLFMGEGMNASVAVTELKGGTRNFHVSGRVEASSEPTDMRMQRMLGHFPALFHPRPRSVLVVGCGAGVTAGTFVLSRDVERIVICEIEPLIPRVVARFFGPQNFDVLDDPRVEMVYDDARHYILTTNEKFDIITSDPIHPWIKGSATLYTKEYFEQCRRHLKPGGIVVQWIPLYESTQDAVKSEMATFFDVFPSATIWSNDFIGIGYDVLVLGQTGEMRIDVDALQQRLDGEDHRAIADSLHKVGFRSAVEILATYAGQASDLKPWLKDAEINRDRNLRLQYLAGMGLNYHLSGLIFSELLAYYRFPDELFIGSEGRLNELRKALGKSDI